MSLLKQIVDDVEGLAEIVPGHKDAVERLINLVPQLEGLVGDVEKIVKSAEQALSGGTTTAAAAPPAPTGAVSLPAAPEPAPAPEGAVSLPAAPEPAPAPEGAVSLPEPPAPDAQA